ncbi:hypothetical protein J8273_4937 [Carpediemonas membranifera]|uniref:Uncharacterized protein n=1 Tax=Carpediemonas membranifera TaxID=201153 RepID=A0A8J6ASU1_9EUKA|nr:hypothetical protein J8273_7966 [Carpediemonas membranifera]KAG9393637.1 hypothetical protein J8273_4937 [Carpediemonas membranifera]|eukprot:KAG9390615.1 hypothetical protein J8273_7966 [Carpediemonas membranifera]
MGDAQPPVTLESLEALVRSQAATIASLSENLDDVRTNAEDVRKPTKIPAVLKEFQHLRALHGEIKSILADPSKETIADITTAINLAVEKRLEFLRVLDSANEEAAAYFIVTAEDISNVKDLVKVAAKAKKAIPATRAHTSHRFAKRPFRNHGYNNHRFQKASGNRNAAPGQQ